MNQKITKIEYVFNIILFLTSCLGLAIFVEHIAGYEYQAWFYANGIHDPYTNVNVVSRWADFSFFTYISLILFCVWGIFKFIACVFKLEKLNKVINNSYLVLFICLNQFIVLILYTISQIAFKGNFGWYGPYPGSYHSMGTSLVLHYFVTTVAIVYFFIHKFDKIEFKKCLYFLIFFVVYGIIVKVTGMYCYTFEWYPYPIFSKKALWHALFWSFDNYNDALAVVLLIVTLALILAIYLLFTFLATKYINRKYIYTANNNNTDKNCLPYMNEQQIVELMYNKSIDDNYEKVLFSSDKRKRILIYMKNNVYSYSIEKLTILDDHERKYAQCYAIWEPDWGRGSISLYDSLENLLVDIAPQILDWKER